MRRLSLGDLSMCVTAGRSCARRVGIRGSRAASPPYLLRVMAAANPARLCEVCSSVSLIAIRLFISACSIRVWVAAVVVVAAWVRVGAVLVPFRKPCPVSASWFRVLVSSCLVIYLPLSGFRRSLLLNSSNSTKLYLCNPEIQPLLDHTCNIADPGINKQV